MRPDSNDTNDPGEPQIPRLRPMGKGPETRIVIGNLYLREKKYAEAIQEFEAAIAEKPDSAMAHFGLGNVYLQQRQPDRAAECYALAEAHYCLGLIHLQLKRLDEAVEEFLLVLRKDPDRPFVHFTLGNVYLAQ